MTLDERERKPERVRGAERSLEIQLGRVGGVEVRPTRFFVWSGEERAEQERVLSLGRAPRNLLIPRRRRELVAGSVRVRSLGNPLLTIALAGVHAARRLRAQRS